MRANSQKHRRSEGFYIAGQQDGRKGSAALVIGALWIFENFLL